MRQGARHTDAHRAVIRARMRDARAQGRPPGRRPAPPEVGRYITAARAEGASWRQIADGLNQLLADTGAPAPPQGAPCWVTSTVRSIYLRVAAQHEGA